MRAPYLSKAGAPARPRSFVPAPRWRLETSAPRSTYARVGRPLLRLVLLVLSAPPALVLGAPIALVNALQFGGWRQVLFSQPRVGRAGRVFWILKFRTMREPASGAASDAARVTRFGRFLRNTHLDELPQLLNVLRGEMDFIGPRPEMLAIDAWARAHIAGFAARGALLPGITGLAQITQGYTEQDERQYRAKLALDRRYIEHLSLLLDLAILARTALWMARRRGWRPAPADAREARRECE